MHTKKLGRLASLTVVGAMAAAGLTVSASAASTPTLTTKSFTNNFSAMKVLKSLAKSGKGKVAAIMPDTVSSTRYVEFDQPDIKKALLAAGLPSSDIIVQNALGSDATQLTDAQTDITNGATVLLIDPFDSGVGKSIETYAKAHGVDVIDYDRLTLGGSAQYYVSFNNVQVGKLIGQGLVSCISAWKIAKPQVVVMHGAATDNNATQFAQGYDSVLKPYFSSGKYVDVVNTADTWDPPTAETEFQEAYTAHPNINAAVIPNDETGSPIISYLQSQHVAPKTFPTTGQDATAQGMAWILEGYQCGSVYKAVYKEAQDAAAMSLILLAGQTPPAALLNGTAVDSADTSIVEPASLLTPTWVTAANMESTVVADKFDTASAICTIAGAAACATAGIK